jgi:hypothetical protein
MPCPCFDKLSMTIVALSLPKGAKHIVFDKL